jgi:hypothetical protein
MFRRNLIPVWVGILFVASTFLMGQDSWPPQGECTVPADCGESNVCTTVDCVDQVCVYTNNDGAACNDDDPCTAGDTCSDGNCVPGFPVCDDGDPCTLDTCTDLGGVPVCTYMDIC